MIKRATVVWYLDDDDDDVAVRCRATLLPSGQGKGVIAVGKRRLAGSLDRGVDSKKRDRSNASSCRTATTDSRRGDEEEMLRREWVGCSPGVFNWVAQAESSKVQSLIESGCLSCRPGFQAFIGQAWSGTRRFNHQQCTFSFPLAIHIAIFNSIQLPVTRRMISKKSSRKSNHAIASSASQFRLLSQVASSRFARPAVPCPAANPVRNLT